MMSSYEVVRRTIEFQGPERLPLHFFSAPSAAMLFTSNGSINAILDDLIDIGLDVIQLLQPQVVGIEEIGRQCRGRICLEGQCDIQKTLLYKDLEDIRNEAGLLLEH
jgi:hypothetical protein